MSKVQKKKLFESFSYELLNTYTSFFLGIFSMFLIARLITPQVWGIYLFAQSFITVVFLFCSFFPPAIEATIQYYIPHSLSKEKDGIFRIRAFILHVYKIRLSFSFMIFFVFLIIISIINLTSELFYILLIISPSILLIIIQNINISILSAFKKFKLISFILILRILIYFLCVFITFFFRPLNPVYLISIGYSLSWIISCSISIILIIPLIPKKKEVNDFIPNKKVRFFVLHKEYGIHLSIASFLSNTTIFIVNYLFYSFNLASYITFLAICASSLRFVQLLSSSNENSYVPIFSEIDFKEEREKFRNLNYQLFKGLALITCIFTGFFFCFIQVYITIIYGEIYLIISEVIQIYLLAAFASLILRNLSMISQSTYNTKNNSKIFVADMILTVLFTLIGLIFFDFLMIIIFKVITLFLLVFLLFYLVNKGTLLKLKIGRFFKPYIIFILSLSISYLISLPIQFQLCHNELLNLIFNSTIKFIIFLLLFYLSIFISKYYTKEEFIQLIDLIPILNSKTTFSKRILSLFEKLLPNKSNKKEIIPDE